MMFQKMKLLVHITHAASLCTVKIYEAPWPNKSQKIRLPQSAPLYKMHLPTGTEKVGALLNVCEMNMHFRASYL